VGIVRGWLASRFSTAPQSPRKKEKNKDRKELWRKTHRNGPVSLGRLHFMCGGVSAAFLRGTSLHGAPQFEHSCSAASYNVIGGDGAVVAAA
jgi:hypothetical protein